MRNVLSSASRSVLSLTVLFLCAIGFLELSIGYANPHADIDVATAYNMITNGSFPDLIILDVRTQSEYDDGHICDSFLIPHTELEVRIGELAGHKNHEIIVYCGTGVRSNIAANILESNNFTKVYDMQGGITAWQNAEHYVCLSSVDLNLVGGTYISVNKIELIAPYIGLTMLLAVAVATVAYAKKRKKA